jgi:hypothetical protein
MPGKCFTWFVVFSHVLSIGLPLKGRSCGRQAAAPATPPQVSRTGRYRRFSLRCSGAPRGGAATGVPSRPERTMYRLPPFPGGMVCLISIARTVEIIHLTQLPLPTIDPEVEETVTINSAEP